MSVKQIAIYARQSVDKKESLSIEAQIEKCESKILENEKYVIYTDKGYSGKNVERPDLQRLITDITFVGVNNILFVF